MTGDHGTTVRNELAILLEMVAEKRWCIKNLIICQEDDSVFKDDIVFNCQFDLNLG